MDKPHMFFILFLLEHSSPSCFPVRQRGCAPVAALALLLFGSLERPCLAGCSGFSAIDICATVLPLCVVHSFFFLISQLSSGYAGTRALLRTFFLPRTACFFEIPRPPLVSPPKRLSPARPVLSDWTPRKGGSAPTGSRNPRPPGSPLSPLFPGCHNNMFILHFG